MTEYEELLSKLLAQKQDLTREEIERLVREKKDKIGAGYLTDQGAIFLIASDLGITLEAPKTEMEIKDLHPGAKEVSLETRVLSLSPTKQYSRKDGSPLLLRTMTVYDGNSTASVKLWDEKANLPGMDSLKPGDLIKIIKAYVKADLKGEPVINIGSGSTIERADSDSPIPPIDSITKEPGQIKEGDSDMAVSGTLDGMIFPMRFTNSRGEPGTALRLSLKGGDGSSIRAVLWGKDETAIPRIVSSDASVKLFGVRAKQGMQGLEIHGGDATTVVIEGGRDDEPITARIISSTKSESGGCHIVGVDRDRNLVNIEDSSENSSAFAEGDIIECMPAKAYGNSVWLDGDSLVRRLDDDPGLAKTEDLRTKISDIQVGGYVCIESVILTKTDRREIQTKRGETVSLSDMLVEDDSAQIWVKGWRNQARLIDKCVVGDVVSITGLSARAGMEGRTELTLTEFSKITPRSSKTP